MLYLTVGMSALLLCGKKIASRHLESSCALYYFFFLPRPLPLPNRIRAKNEQFEIVGVIFEEVRNALFRAEDR